VRVGLIQRVLILIVDKTKLDRSENPPNTL
jgi:hypothetical protein